MSGRPPTPATTIAAHVAVVGITENGPDGTMAVARLSFHGADVNPSYVKRR